MQDSSNSKNDPQLVASLSRAAAFFASSARGTQSIWFLEYRLYGRGRLIWR